MKWLKKITNARRALLLSALLGMMQGASATAIVATPGSLDFGSVISGQSSALQQITLTVTDLLYDVNIDALSVPGGFIFNNNCPAFIGSNQSSCTVDVRFFPNATGPFSGNFQVDYSDAQTLPEVGSDTVALQGIGIPRPFADLSVVPVALGFGTVSVGSSTSLSVSVSNVGTGSMDLDPLFITGSGEFSQSNTCGNALAAGQSCTATVVFNPTLAAGNFSTLEIRGMDDFSEDALAESVSLTGTAVEVDISINPGSLSFNGTLLGDVSSTQPLTLVNTTSGDLLLAQISVEEPFTQSNNCGSVLSSGSSCIANVAFAPSNIGTFGGEFRVSGSDPSQSVSFVFTAVLSGSTPNKSDIEDILGQIDTGGNPNLESVIVVIADTCTSGRANSDLQGDCNALIVAADDGDLGAADALREITPERATKATRLVHESGMAQMANVATRLASLRNRNSGSSLAGLRFNVNGKMVSAAQMPGMQTGGSAGAEDGLLNSSLGGWVSGTISTGEKNGTGLDSGLDFSTSGVTAGVDYRINEQWVLGGALGYMNTNSDLDNRGGRVDATGYSLTAYGTYLGWQSFYMDFSLTYGSNNFDQKRNLLFTLQNQGVTDQTAKADYDGDMFSFTLGSGYDFHSGGWTFGPRGHLDYIKVGVDGFTEQMSNPFGNGAGWATSLEDTDQTWLTLKLGGKATYAHGMSWGVLTPYVGADWLHEFKDDSQLIQGNFAGDPGSLNFRIQSENPDKNYFQVNLGIGAVFQNGIFGFLDYKTILSNDRWDRQTFNAGLRMEF